MFSEGRERVQWEATVKQLKVDLSWIMLDLRIISLTTRAIHVFSRTAS